MDVSGIASWSTQMANEKTAVAVEVAMLKKAFDLQEIGLTLLLEAVPALPANPNVGRNVNTTA